MIKLKPVLPTQRENKRYISFNVVSKEKIAYNSLKEGIKLSLKSYIGDLGVSRAGLIFMDKLYDPKTQTGVIRVNNKYDNHLRASFALIKKINKEQVIIRSIKSSGMINKIKGDKKCNQ
ncbi:MAG: Rpp14/Pop5 family protein [Candidatus Woesearchaeota archaeon]